MTVCIIGIDPGPTTGLAWGKFNPALRDRTSVWKAMARGRGLGCMQIGPKERMEHMGGVVPGDAFAASLMVAERVASLIAGFNIDGYGKSDIHIICEDFSIRGPGASSAKPGAGMKTGLAPVFVSGVLFGTLSAIGWADTLSFVQAGVHKPYATDARLKRLGVASKGRVGWIKGKQHTRDAWRLVAWKFSEVA